MTNRLAGEAAVAAVKAAIAQGEEKFTSAAEHKACLKPLPAPYKPRIPGKPLHVIVHRGTEGFADRLQVLANCIEYAKLNSALLCVDWRDPWWVCGFDKYFDIVGVETISVDDVASMIETGATTYPVHTAEEFKLPLTKETAHSKRFYLNSILLKRDYDIVINTGSTNRAIMPEHMTHALVLKLEIANILAAVMCKMKPPFAICHLRGTDRTYGKSIDDTLFPIRKALRERSASDKVSAVYMIGDSVVLKKRLLELHPEVKPLPSMTYTIDTLNGPSDGSHCVAIDADLKHKLNIETLLDFSVMAMAKRKYSTCKKSYFFKMASILRGEIFLWFRLLSTLKTQSEQ